MMGWDEQQAYDDEMNARPQPKHFEPNPNRKNYCLHCLRHLDDHDKATSECPKNHEP